MDMQKKEDIRILNVLCYTDKETKKEKTRVGFIFTGAEQLSDSANFKGFSELACFYDGNLVKNLPVDLICKPVKASFEVRSNRTNPMKSTMIIKDVEFNHNVYNLL